ncbi:MAG: protein kinase [Kiritimatiellae bacterium]|nr:protein kinase [Kiritimatiellia bacterium]
MAPDHTDSAKAALKPGEVFGQYRIVRLLGRGGMGEVYEAEHTTLELCYALKLLPADFAARPDALDRFRREAKVMAKLQHPCIVRVDDFGETVGRYWLRMELVPGLTLAPGPDRVVALDDYAAALGGRIGQAELVGILNQILDALAYAHRHGAIHRDLKPSNILLGDPGPAGSGPVAKIADFGLVRLVGDEWVRSRAELSVRLSLSMGEGRTLDGVPGAEGEGTSTRAILGTYEYMSPEQKRGEDADARSDIYALGLMTYRLLTGRREIGFRLPSQIDPGLVPGWDELVGAALEPERDQRLAGCADFARLLQAVAGAVPAAPAARPMPPPLPPEVQTPPPPVERQSTREDRVDTALPASTRGVHCPGCGKPNDAYENFCVHCGGQLAAVLLTCAKCETLLGRDDGFCTECGTPVRKQDDR